MLNLDRISLAEFGGHVSLTKDWAKSLLHRTGFGKRRGTTKSKVTVEKFERIRVDFLEEIVTTVTMEEIPAELIFNCDQTSLNLILSSNWTMELRGSKRVEVTDKQQTYGCPLWYPHRRLPSPTGGLYRKNQEMPPYPTSHPTGMSLTR